MGFLELLGSPSTGGRSSGVVAGDGRLAAERGDAVDDFGVSMGKLLNQVSHLSPQTYGLPLFGDGVSGAAGLTIDLICTTPLALLLQPALPGAFASLVTPA
jgi:hypothetical protein